VFEAAGAFRKNISLLCAGFCAVKPGQKFVSLYRKLYDQLSSGNALVENTVHRANIKRLEGEIRGMKLLSSHLNEWEWQANRKCVRIQEKYCKREGLSTIRIA